MATIPSSRALPLLASTVVLLLSLSSAAFAQSGATPLQSTPDAVIAEANSLIGRQQFESAYRLLDRTDPTNRIPALAILKVQILLHDSVTSDKDESFTLADLKPGQSLASLAPDAASLHHVTFDAEKVLGELIVANPTNGALHQALGDFYLDVRLRYGNSWVKNAQTLVSLALENYQKAKGLGDDSAEVESRLGLLYLMQQDYAKAVESYTGAIKAEGDKPSTDDVYNAAYAYLLSGDTATALGYAKAAAESYSEPHAKADALRLVAEIYGKQGDDSKAIATYLQVLAVSANDTLSLEHLVDLYLKAGDYTSASQRATQLFATFPSNPDSAGFLTQVYLAHQQPERLITLFKTLAGTYQNDDASLGNILYYEGLLYAREGRTADAVAQLKQAEAHLKIAYPASPELFDRIDKIIAEIQKDSAGATGK